LIKLLKNSSEGLSEVDAHSIEPCVFCNHFFKKLAVACEAGASNLVGAF